MLTNAAMVIQRYYRGWRVRRLFQLRRKSHPDFKKVEYNVRRIAFLLAKETDSVFAQRDPLTGEYGGGNLEKLAGAGVSVADITVDPEKVPPTILPTPPHWSVDLLRFLLDRHPWLITIHPHANCVPHHVKIQELTGELPKTVKDFSWYPFLREVIKVPEQRKSCFVELNLQVYPVLGIHMKIINNDNGNILRQVTNRMFIGRLFENKHGYTVFCYRWAIPTMRQESNDRPPSSLWKLRLVTPHDQDGPKFQTRAEFLAEVVSGEDGGDEPETLNRASLAEDDNGGGGGKPNSIDYPSPVEFPNKLILRRLTGYYTPNKDYSVCQYMLETDEKRATISLRFLASNPNVRLRIHVWDCNKKAIVFDEICENGLIAPTIKLHESRQRLKRTESPEETELPSPTNDTGSLEGLHSPVSEVLEGSNSDLLEAIMSTNTINMYNNASKASSKQLIGDEDEENGNAEASRGNSLEIQVQSKELIRKESDKGTETFVAPEKKKGTHKRRYIISVYVVDDTWPLTDRELLYVLYRERKFFRNIKAHHCKAVEKKQEEARKKAEEEELAAPASPAAVKAEGQVTNEQTRQSLQVQDLPGPTATVGEGVHAGPTTPAMEQADGKKDVFPSVKRKTKKKDGEKGGLVGNENNGNTSTVPTSQQQGDSSATTAYPNTPPPSTISASNIAIAFGDDITKVGQSATVGKRSKDGKIKRMINGCMLVKYGGHQSQNVKHLDQPHWVMEIVTETKVKYKLKSNWQILRKRLLLAKESWESGGVELLYQDLSTRLDFLLENMVEENYNKVKQHKFIIVDPMTNLFSCLRMDDYNLVGFSNHDFIRLLVQAWSVDPEENRKAGEKLLQKRKTKLPIILNEQEQPPESPKPEQILDYIPKNLRQLAETFYQRIEEREMERERVQRQSKLKPMNSSEDVEEGDEEEEGEADSPLAGAGIGGTAFEHPHPHSHPLVAADGDAGVSPTLYLGIPGSTVRGARKTNSDARTERSVTKKINKKQPDLPAASVKPNTKKPKETRASIKQGKTTAQELEPIKSQRNSRADSEKRRSGGAGASENKEDEPKENSETELSRIRSCSYVTEIFRRYESFFNEPKSIRTELLEMIEREQRQVSDGMGGSRKVLLAKTGISKYVERHRMGDVTGIRQEGEEDNPPEEEENMESVVGQKLLRWAYDYSCLPPTEERYEVIKDPGELPLYLMQTIMEEQRIRERLEEELRSAAATEADDEEKMGEQDE